MAQVHHEEVAVHVEALPAGQVVLLVEVELSHQHGVADRPDVATRLAGAYGEVDVVVEDEERRVGEADLGDHTAAHHEPLEGDVLHLDQRWHRRAVGVRRVDRGALGPDGERVAQVELHRRLLHERAGQVLAHGDEAVLVDGHQRGQAVGCGNDVVVHQPDPVEALVVRRPHPAVEAAGAAEVLLRDHLERQVGAGRPLGEHLARVVGAPVVDDDDRVRGVGLRGEPVEHADEQVGAVVGHHDDRDRLACTHWTWLTTGTSGVPRSRPRCRRASRAG